VHLGRVDDGDVQIAAALQQAVTAMPAAPPPMTTTS
jgi:hypothetical protein